MVRGKGKWNVTVAKSGVIEVEASSRKEVLEIISKEILTEKIEWEDSWNIVDVEASECSDV